jgi:hypothetical protein
MSATAPATIALVALALAQTVDVSETPRFREIGEEAGLTFRHVNGATGQYHLPEIMGAGGALLDYDMDGDLDVLLLQGRALEGQDPAAGGHRLYRNDLAPSSGTPLRFTDVTARSGFAPGDYGMGAAVGDYDNDNDPDVYVTNFGPNRLYRNNGDGTFADVTSASGPGLDDPRWSTSASFSDYDADGDLDLFVTNYVDFTVLGAKACHEPAGARDYCGPLQFRPLPDRLFRNDGTGTFSDVTDFAGIGGTSGNGLGVAAADFNQDGRSDFYVANDGMANNMWLSRANGTFADEALVSGTAFNADGRPEGSMGLAVGDPDNDGDDDIVVTNIARETHAFYRNLGRARFEDARVAAGLGAATAPYTGFGTDWIDYDNDGWLDLFVANGAVTMIEALRGDPLPFRQPNQLLRNDRRGTFHDMTTQAGSALAISEVSRGAAFGDIDNDGDVDVLVTTNNGAVRLLLNETASRHHWLEARLEGTVDNRQGLGARVGLRRADGRTIWKRAHTDGSYLSSSDPRVHFGLGSAADGASVVVYWPGGLREEWKAAEVDRIVTLKQGTGRPAR